MNFGRGLLLWLPGIALPIIRLRAIFWHRRGEAGMPDAPVVGRRDQRAIDL